MQDPAWRVVYGWFLSEVHTRRREGRRRLSQDLRQGQIGLRAVRELPEIQGQARERYGAVM